jgi:hypothetical protein
LRVQGQNAPTLKATRRSGDDASPWAQTAWSFRSGLANLVQTQRRVGTSIYLFTCSTN